MKRAWKKITIGIMATIICGLLFVWLSPLKIVKIYHETYFHEDYYYYLIDIYKQNQSYFENVNKNEISFTKVIPANIAYGTEYFLTFQDSIDIFIRTEFYDTSNYVPLDKFTLIRIQPCSKSTMIRASSRCEPLED